MGKIVNCRVGSLEKTVLPYDSKPQVNCRVGSLEKDEPLYRSELDVNCRVGSLETKTLGSIRSECR